MKAITICQPYAALVVTPQAELPPGVQQKRVENRTRPEPWNTHKGPLLIHAGKSRAWMDDNDEYGIPASQLAFGAIVGVADLVAVGSLFALRRGDRHILQRFPWIADHQHTEGPWCLVLANAVKFQETIPYRGALGLFYVPDDSGPVRQYHAELDALAKAQGARSHV